MNNMQNAMIVLNNWNRMNAEGNPRSYGQHVMTFLSSAMAISNELDMDTMLNDLYAGGPNHYVFIDEGDTQSDMIENLETNCMADAWHAVKDANPHLTDGDVGSVAVLGQAELLIDASNAGAVPSIVGVHASILRSIILNDLQRAISLGISNLQLAA